ncbi:MAG: glycine betaine ABC transporter substrate-binding protein [Pseudomonadota bacterium]
MSVTARSIVVVAATFVALAAARADEVTIGSKNFPESYLLAEIAAQWLERDGHVVERRFGFGGTKVAYEALVGAEIDFYPEYSGTILSAILDGAELANDIDTINAELAKQALVFTGQLGFNNTYAVAVRRDDAEREGWRRVSDLAATDDLRFAFSHEFLQRNDGWPGLAAAYRLPRKATGIEHGLAYRALANGDIDVTDAYSTDGDIARFDLVLLEDTLNYFPRYDAGWLAGQSLAPAVRARLHALTGQLDDAGMRDLNARVVVDGLSFAEAATEFVNRLDGSSAAAPSRTGEPALWPLVLRHVQLTLAAIAAATLAGFALALATYRSARASGALLYIAGLIQTIPSIALLALMIPLLGIGFVPALVALFLYALLPVLRATLTALAAVEPVHRQVAAAMGMSGQQEFMHVLLPLALPHALAGIRTAAVISIGTATLAAFIGAGGLGEPIVTGLALNDTRMILSGAIPAALLAVGTDLAFDVLERRLVPPHMRVSR